VRKGRRRTGRTGVDRGFTSSDGHVGGVGDEGGTLHDGLLNTVNVDGKLGELHEDYECERMVSFVQKEKGEKANAPSAISLPRSPHPT
jgi:hypothetical protein